MKVILAILMVMSFAALAAAEPRDYGPDKNKTYFEDLSQRLP